MGICCLTQGTKTGLGDRLKVGIGKEVQEGGEERDGEMYGKSNMETYNTICKIDSQWEFAVCLRELKQGSVAT